MLTRKLQLIKYKMIHMLWKQIAAAKGLEKINLFLATPQRKDRDKEYSDYQTAIHISHTNKILLTYCFIDYTKVSNYVHFNKLRIRLKSMSTRSTHLPIEEFVWWPGGNKQNIYQHNKSRERKKNVPKIHTVDFILWLICRNAYSFLEEIKIWINSMEQKLGYYVNKIILKLGSKEEISHWRWEGKIFAFLKQI